MSSCACEFGVFADSSVDVPLGGVCQVLYGDGRESDSGDEDEVE